MAVVETSMYDLKEVLSAKSIGEFLEPFTHLRISATGFCPNRSMSFHENGRGAITGSKLTGDRKSHCTGANYLERRHKSISLVIYDKRKVFRGRSTAWVKSACCDLVVENRRAAARTAQGVASSLNDMIFS